MNILFVYADNPREWNCSQWRVVNPARAINDYIAKQSTGSMISGQAEMIYVQEFAEWSENARAKCDEADVIVIQRLVLANMIEKVLDLQMRGKVVVGEVDDAYHLMPNNLNSYKFWHEGVVTVMDDNNKPQQAKMTIPPIEQLEWGMKMVDAITAPSELLLEDWKKFNPNTYYIPNFIDSSIYLKHKIKARQDPHFTIGWGGSFSHLNSWTKSNIIEALHKIVDMHPGTKIVIAGGDKRIAEELKLKRHALKSYEWVSHDEWPKILSTFDIGLVPLAGPYDARRSYIKTLEYMIMGIPWVGTKAQPTAFFSEYGTVVTNSVEAWRRGINNAIVNWMNEKDKVDSGFELALSLDVSKKAEWLFQKYQEIYTEQVGSN